MVVLFDLSSMDAADKWRVVLKSQNLKETYIHASYANVSSYVTTGLPRCLVGNFWRCKFTVLWLKRLWNCFLADNETD